VLIQGDRPPQDTPVEHGMYAFTIDVGGQDEAVMSDPYAAPTNPGRDHTTLSIIEVDNSTLPDMHLQTYRVVKRLSWAGENHMTVLNHLKALGNVWHPAHVVIDATGVGEGLWAMLEGNFPGKVTPIRYTAQVKSKIYYDFLAMINTGRFKDCDPNSKVEAQYRNCQAEALIGPSQLIRWGVPEGKRGTDGNLIHDDHLMADSLTAILDQLEWIPYIESGIIQGEDPLEWMDKNFGGNHYNDDQ